MNLSFSHQTVVRKEGKSGSGSSGRHGLDLFKWFSNAELIFLRETVHWRSQYPTRLPQAQQQNKWNYMEHAVHKVSKILEAYEDMGANSVLT